MVTSPLLDLAVQLEDSADFYQWHPSVDLWVRHTYHSKFSRFGYGRRRNYPGARNQQQARTNQILYAFWKQKDPEWFEAKSYVTYSKLTGTIYGKAVQTTTDKHAGFPIFNYVEITVMDENQTASTAGPVPHWAAQQLDYTVVIEIQIRPKKVWK